MLIKEENLIETFTTFIMLQKILFIFKNTKNKHL